MNCAAKRPRESALLGHQHLIDLKNQITIYSQQDDEEKKNELH